MTNDKIKEVAQYVYETCRAEADPIAGRAIAYLWLFTADLEARIEAPPLRLPTQDERNGVHKGAVECREMMARFVEAQGHPEIAVSIRANWNPAWGDDPRRGTWG